LKKATGREQHAVKGMTDRTLTVFRNVRSAFCRDNEITALKKPHRYQRDEQSIWQTAALVRRSYRSIIARRYTGDRPQEGMSK